MSETHQKIGESPMPPRGHFVVGGLGPTRSAFGKQSHRPTRAHPGTSRDLQGTPRRPPKGTYLHLLGTTLTRPQIGAAFEGRYPIMLVDPPFEVLSKGRYPCKKLTRMRPGRNQFSNALSGNV